MTWGSACSTDHIINRYRTQCMVIFIKLKKKSFISSVKRAQQSYRNRQQEKYLRGLQVGMWRDGSQARCSHSSPKDRVSGGWRRLVQCCGVLFVRSHLFFELHFRRRAKLQQEWSDSNEALSSPRQFCELRDAPGRKRARWLLQSSQASIEKPWHSSCRILPLLAPGAGGDCGPFSGAVIVPS